MRTGFLLLGFVSMLGIAACGGGDDEDLTGAVDAGDDLDASSTWDGAPGADADPTAADAGTGITCGNMTCEATQECCIASGSASCVEQGTCETATIGCDGPEDCSDGDVCCGGGGGTMCTASASCEQTVCHTSDDCPEADQECCPAGPGSTSMCFAQCPGA